MKSEASSSTDQLSAYFWSLNKLTIRDAHVEQELAQSRPDMTPVLKPQKFVSSGIPATSNQQPDSSMMKRISKLPITTIKVANPIAAFKCGSNSLSPKPCNPVPVWSRPGSGLPNKHDTTANRYGSPVRPRRSGVDTPMSVSNSSVVSGILRDPKLGCLVNQRSGSPSAAQSTGNLVNPIVTEPRQARSPGVLYLRSHRFGSPGRPAHLAPSINRVEYINGCLQRCLQEVKSIPTRHRWMFAQEVSPRAANNSPFPMQSSTTHNIHSSPDPSVSRSGLKELLQNPTKTGTQMSVQQFRRLESNSLNETRKSCLKAKTPVSQESSQFSSVDKQTPPKRTLTRQVSFSENVVMFIYQA